jgi:hypothetical protein
MSLKDSKEYDDAWNVTTTGGSLLKKSREYDNTWDSNGVETSDKPNIQISDMFMGDKSFHKSKRLNPLPQFFPHPNRRVPLCFLVSSRRIKNV